MEHDDAQAQGLTFTIDSPESATFQVDVERRTIRGQAIVFGDVGESRGRRWRFSAASVLNVAGMKFLNGHDWSQLMGAATLTQNADGWEFVGKVKSGPDGDSLLELAGPDFQAIDGLSVGLGQNVKARLAQDGVYDVLSADVIETSTTPLPAFTRARITSVAASAAPSQEGTTHMEHENTPAADGQPGPEAPAQFAAPPAAGTDLANQVAALAEQVATMSRMRVPVESTSFQVREEPMYRFSGTIPAPSGFDFATDLLAAAQGDSAARARLMEFTQERAAAAGPAFVDTTDVAQVNPAQYRPDLFLGQAPVPTSPLFDFFTKGGLANAQPFYWSKLNRASTTVGMDDHVEGVDPTPGDLVVQTGATVTPEAISGQAFITREVGDMGGNPNVSGLVFAELERSFSIARETKTAALLAAAAAAGSVTDLTAMAALAAGADGVAAGAALERDLVGLQFIPDGTRFQRAFGHADLYTALATAKNADDENVYPIINPQNRQGVTGDRYSFIDVAGYRMNPAHSLGASSAGSSDSWLADPAAVHVWASGLQRFDKLQETVAGWNVGAFAYWAGIVYDTDGLRTIPYDPTA